MDNIKMNFIILGLLILYLIISFSIFFFLEKTLPDYSFFFGIDESGEVFDRRFVFGSLIGLPITYIVILGFNSWKNNWKDGDYIIRKIDEKFNIVSKLELEKKDNYVFGDDLLEKVREAIIRTYK